MGAGGSLTVCLPPQDWQVRYQQDTPVAPRFDVNAPDLYIPSTSRPPSPPFPSRGTPISPPSPPFPPRGTPPNDIPVSPPAAMAFITYILVACLALGTQSRSGPSPRPGAAGGGAGPYPKNEGWGVQARLWGTPHPIWGAAPPQVLPRQPGLAGELGAGLAHRGGSGHPPQPLPPRRQHQPHHHRPHRLHRLQICGVRGLVFLGGVG